VPWWGVGQCTQEEVECPGPATWYLGVYHLLLQKEGFEMLRDFFPPAPAPAPAVAPGRSRRWPLLPWCCTYKLRCAHRGEAEDK
jgi:hypothetical protein